MFFPIPPLVILIPTMLALGIQIVAPIVGLAAVIAMVANCSIQVRLRFFDGVLALRSVIGVGQWRRCYKPHEHRSHYCCHCGLSKS
jgi:hypothetical protein